MSKTKPKHKPPSAKNQRGKKFTKKVIKEDPKIIRHKTIDGKKLKLHLLETNTHLRTIVEYQEAGKPAVGAILMNTGTLKEPQYRVRFVLRCGGYHDYQNPLQAEATITGIHALLKEIPQAESLRVYYDCFPDSIDRELELNDTFHRMYDNIDCEPCSTMLVEEIKILREGHHLGRRRQQQLHLAVTYTARNETRMKDDLEKAIEFILSIPQNFFGKVSGSTKLLAEEVLDRFLLRAYESGYQFWSTLIRERLQMDFVPLDGEGIWQFCRADSNRFYDRQLRANAIDNNIEYRVPPAPHLVTYNLSTDRISEVNHSTLHPTSVIFQESSSLPSTGRDYVKIDGKYVGCMYLKTQPKSFDSTSTRSLAEVQLFYLWDILAQPFCRDLRVVLEMTTVEELSVNLNNDDLLKQSNEQLKEAKKKGKIDVRAEMQLEEAIEVQRGLVSGDPTLDFGLTVFIHRDTLAQMRATVRKMKLCFRTPSVMIQDTDTADALWIQSLPYYGKSLLVDSRDRRDRTHANVLASYMPLLIPQSPHDRGLEFIAVNGGTPIYFDPFNPKKQGHIAVWGQTRSGKSLLVGWIVVRGLIDGVKTTIIDRPPSGEASTFKDFTKRLNGAYIDVLVDALNPF
jgi:hypothetical protein